MMIFGDLKMENLFVEWHTNFAMNKLLIGPYQIYFRTIFQYDAEKNVVKIDMYDVKIETDSNVEQNCHNL